MRFFETTLRAVSIILIMYRINLGPKVLRNCFLHWALRVANPLCIRIYWLLQYNIAQLTNFKNMELFYFCNIINPHKVWIVKGNVSSSHEMDKAPASNCIESFPHKECSRGPKFRYLARQARRLFVINIHSYHHWGVTSGTVCMCKGM